MKPPRGTSDESISYVATLIMKLLKQGTGDLLLEESLVGLLFAFPSVFDFDTHALAACVMRQPGLVRRFPELRDPKVFGEDWNILSFKVPEATAVPRSFKFG